MVSFWLDRLAASRSETAKSLFCSNITTWQNSLIAALEKCGVTLASIPYAQQRLIARTMVWRSEPWLSCIPQAAAAFEAELRQMHAASLLASFRQPIVVRYLPLEGCLWKTGSKMGRDKISIADIFLLDESGDMPRRLARFLGGRPGRGMQAERKALQAWVHTDRVVSYIQALERHLTPAAAEQASPGFSTRGRAYDLAALYEAVNREYFSGSLSRPALSWSRRAARCRAGFYDALSNRISIFSALDNSSVPEYVVRFLLYHEMLHQKERIGLLTKKTHAHTPAFRLEERKFERYTEAEAYLRALAIKAEPRTQRFKPV